MHPDVEVGGLVADSPALHRKVNNLPTKQLVTAATWGSFTSSPSFSVNLPCDLDDTSTSEAAGGHGHQRVPMLLLHSIQNLLELVSH